MIEPDPNYRLPEVERQRLRRVFDADALERLLARVPPEKREDILASFRIPDGNTTDELWSFGEPALQEILEEVWTPYWDRLSVEDIRRDESGRPGKGAALRRRERNPHPHEVLLLALSAIAEGRWGELARLLESEDDTSRIQARRTLTGPFVIVGGVQETPEIVHVLYRRLPPGVTPGDVPVEVQTVRRLGGRWVLRTDDLVRQSAAFH